MKNENLEEEGLFYARIAELLGVENAYKPWTGRPPNRWNNRAPGNGRYPGFGTIRWFGPNLIQVCLRDPVALNRMFTSEDAVFEAIAKLRSSS